MVRMRRDIELRQVVRAQELGIDGQGTDGPPVAIAAQVTQRDPLGRRIGGTVEKPRHGGMPVVVAALCLPDANVGQLGLGGNPLVGVGTEEDFGLPGQVVPQQQAQANRGAAPQGNQAGRGTGGGVEVRRRQERRCRGPDGNAVVVIAGVRMDGDTDLPQISHTGGPSGRCSCRREGRPQDPQEKRHGGYDHQQLEEREGPRTAPSAVTEAALPRRSHADAKRCPVPSAIRIRPYFHNCQPLLIHRSRGRPPDPSETSRKVLP